jgi:hypothetical protein
MRWAVLMLFSTLAYAQTTSIQGYTGTTSTGYIPLPGCPGSGACTSVNVPKSDGSGGTVAVTTANIGTVGGYLTGAGTVINGLDDPSYGNHKIIRLTDANSASTNLNINWNAGQANSNSANANSTLFLIASDGGNQWVQGFNPSTLAVAPLGTVKYNQPETFDATNPLKLYILANVNTGTFVATQGAQIYALTLSVNGSGTPSVASAALVADLTSGTGALPSAANAYTWNGNFKASRDGTSFAVPFSLVGGQSKGYMFATWSAALGTRVWYTDSRIVTGDPTKGPTSCVDGTTDCFDGTTFRTNANYVPWDWAVNTTFATNALISPYLNNTHHCVFKASVGGKTAVSGNGPNWDSLDGGSCTFAGTITDNAATWVLSTTNGGNGVGVNGGLCGSNGSYNSGQFGACTPISETDTFSMHDASQLSQAGYTSLSPSVNDALDSSGSGCFQNNGFCQNGNVGNYIWRPATMTAVNCIESVIAAQADWTPGATVNSSGINGIPTAGGNIPNVVIFPRNGGGRSGNGNQYGGGVYPINFYYYKMTTPGVSALAGHEPTWTQSNGATVTDGTVVWTAFANNGGDGSCNAHEGQGYSHIFEGSNYYATYPLANFGAYLNQIQNSTYSFSDNHTSQANSNVSDTNPLMVFTTQVDNPTTGLWTNSSTISTTLCSGNCAFWNELAAIFPNYAAVNSASLLRFGHSWNSGSSFQFAEQNGLGGVTPDGNWLYWTSDFECTLGSQAGAATCTCGSSTSTGGRNDVFLMQLRPNGYSIPAPAPTFAELLFGGPIQ